MFIYLFKPIIFQSIFKFYDLELQRVNTLQVIQNKCLRLVLGKYKINNKEAHDMTGVPRIKEKLDRTAERAFETIKLKANMEIIELYHKQTAPFKTRYPMANHMDFAPHYRA